MKILVISAYRGIGDLIFHLPLFKYLNKKFKTKINLITVHNSKAKYILKKEKIISKIVYGDFNRQQILKNINHLFMINNKIILINYYKWINLNPNRNILKYQFQNNKI